MYTIPCCVASKRWHMLKIAERKFNFRSIYKQLFTNRNELIRSLQTYKPFRRDLLCELYRKTLNINDIFWVTWVEGTLALSRVNSDVNRTFINKICRKYLKNGNNYGSSPFMGLFKKIACYVVYMQLIFILNSVPVNVQREFLS